jgi:hypothetical protein
MKLLLVVILSLQSLELFAQTTAEPNSPPAQPQRSAEIPPARRLSLERRGAALAQRERVEVLGHRIGGGQEGNGGNVCEVSPGTWVTFEELKARAPVDSSPGEQVVVTARRGFANRSDLLNTRAGAEVLKRFFGGPLQLWKPGVNLASSTSVLLVLARVTNDVTRRGYEVGSRALCRGRVRAAIHLSRDGLLVISAPIWNRLSARSQEVLLIHEVLRYVQRFTSWLPSLSNQQLEDMTWWWHQEDYAAIEATPLLRVFSGPDEARVHRVVCASYRLPSELCQTNRPAEAMIGIRAFLQTLRLKATTREQLTWVQLGVVLAHEDPEEAGRLLTRTIHQSVNPYVDVAVGF